MLRPRPWLLIAVLAAWFWPVLLGQRPAGPGVDSQALPMAAVYHDALAEGRVPEWNERDGLGSPAVADGVLGVYYPPHQLLHRLFSPPTAWTVSLLAHTLLAAWFAWLCAAGFGLTPLGCLLAAVVFAGQGFFMAGADRTWVHTTGCWLPLAVLATWRWLEDRSFPWLFGLAGVLAVQALAGHFQVAWMTIVTVVVLGLGKTVLGPGGRVRLAARLVGVLLAIAAAAALAAVQLVPSAELALVGDSRGRGPGYLSNHSTPPLTMLAGHLAPFLLHRDPLWSAAVWAPARSSPVETLPYVGLLTVGLAVLGAAAAWRERRVRLWLLLLVVALLLSLGRFLPGFVLLVECPGFGWFPAPGRWSVVAGLWWGLLAGCGLQQLDLARGGRWCNRYGWGALLVLALTTWAIVDGASRTDAFYQGPAPGVHARLLAAGYSVDDIRFGTLTPGIQLKRLLVTGLLPPILVLTGLGLLGLSTWPARHASRLPALVVVLIVLDLGLSAQFLRPLRFTSIGWDPAVQSPLLRRLVRLGDHRVLAPLGRLPMAVGLATFDNRGLANPQVQWSGHTDPASGWWPSDPPTLPQPARQDELDVLLSQRPDRMLPDDALLMRLTGTRTLIVGGDTPPPLPEGPLRAAGRTDDPWLATAVHGPSGLLASDGPSFGTWTLPPDVPAARAWFVPLDSPVEPGSDPTASPRPPPASRGTFEPSGPAEPVEEIEDAGESVVLRYTCDQAGVLVLADQAYPGWQATRRVLGDTKGVVETVEVETAWGRYRAVRLPAAATWEVRFFFESESHRLGKLISLLALSAWLALGVWLWRHRDRLRATEPARIESG